MFKALEVRIYPDEKQEVLINKTFGCVRLVFNEMLGERQEVHNKFKDDKKSLYTHKYKTEKDLKVEFEFLKEVDSKALQQASRNLDVAFKNAYASLSGKRKGPKMGFPVFKKKGGKESFKTLGAIKFLHGEQEIQLPKLGKVKFRHKDIQDWYLESELKSITVKRTASGKYFAVLLFKGEDDSKPRNTSKPLKVIGLDMSLTSLYVDSNGNKPEDFQKQFQKNHKRLARAQRRVSRKPMGSQNRLKASRKAACVHEKIVNCRKDYSRKLARSIVMENDVVGIETLNLNAMKKSRYGKSIMEVSWSGFEADLKNNARKQGKLVYKVASNYASSKTCSCCGHKNMELKVWDRSWTCTCGVTHDRDNNAAVNIKNKTIERLGQEMSESTSMEMDSSGRLIRNGNVISRTVDEVENSSSDGRKLSPKE